jgi:uncharacterized protein (TIGR03437 family)
LNRPCEIVAGGSRVEPDMSYISPVAGLGACFDSGGAFDVNLAGCPLDNGRQLRIERPAQRMLQPPATWQATVTGDAFAYYRYKSVRAGAGDCRSLDGYSGPRRVADSDRIDDPIGVENGVYFLCVVGGEVSRMDGAWQDPRFASATLVIIDSTPPVESVRYRLDTAGADSYRLSFEFAPPELSSYSYKIGPPETSNCADPSGYLIYRRVPLVIRAAEPSAVCAKAQDEAGNFSPPIEIRLDGERILPFGIVNAASFRPGPIAPGQLVSVFGVNLPGETVTLTDAAGVARPARILYSSPWQVNLLVPAEASLGPGRLAVSDRETQAVEVASAAPGLFLAGRQGPGPAIFLVRVRADGSREVEPAFRCENANCALSPLQLGAGSEEHFLEILGTGIRGAVSGVRARIGRQPVEVRGPGPQESLEGLDRIILKLPRPFLLRGYQQVTLEAGGQQANGVFLWFK